MVRPSKRCCVCEAKVGDADMIPLGKEGQFALHVTSAVTDRVAGTGYAANGGVEVKRNIVSFRV